MSQKNDFNLIDEMARGCLYRGGASEENFLKGYTKAGLVIIPLILLAYGIEVLIGWLS